MTIEHETGTKAIIDNQLKVANWLFQQLSQNQSQVMNGGLQIASKWRNLNLEYDLSHQINDIRRELIQIRLKDSLGYQLTTEFPVAYASNDHIAPYGTINDNTRHPRFVSACERHFGGRMLKVMDMGCSGGGIVYDFLSSGHRALGLEGSDLSFKSKRAEWRVIPDHLFTCDISKPFKVISKDNAAEEKFDVISMWEVMEHIREEDLPALFENILHHLSEDGIFVGSIALQDDVVNGVSYHPTVKPRDWWEKIYRKFGLKMLGNPYEIFDFGDYCRGVGNGPLDPSFIKFPQYGFHFFSTKISK